MRWTSWPQKGEKQLIEIELKKETNIQSVGVYSYNDNQGVKSPEEWLLEYFSKDQWHSFPIYVTDSYSSSQNKYNVVHPGEEIVTAKLRITIQPQTNFVAGVLDVSVAEIE